MTKPRANQVAGLLPSQPKIRIQQTPGKVAIKTLATLEHLIVVLPASLPASLWKEIPDGSHLQSLTRKRKIKAAPIGTRVANAANTGISLQQLPEGETAASEFALLTFAGGLAAHALRDNPATIGLLAAGFDPDETARILRALMLALDAHRFALPAYKSTPAAPKRLRRINLLGTKQPVDTRRTQTEANATNLARWLTSLPPNKLDAGAYRKILDRLAKQHGWKMKFLDEKALRRTGAGAFLAVAQGNADSDAGIAHLRYTPKAKARSKTGKKTAKPGLALVGKGIIFDTGGTNLKPFKAMLDMHCDMAGSAVALATLLALTELDYDGSVDCWLAITENRLSNDAYKSRDIVTAVNGTTIEVIHTDAEGRMALADTLALAGKQSPHTIIDFATLTGTCVSALTDRYSGAFTNRPELHGAVIAAGQQSGERVWPFPLDPDFDEELRSEVADVLQCAAAGGGDHIQAARFLQRFIPKKSAWVHIDLSAATRKGGLAQIPTEITGFGVRFALNLILNQLPAIASGKKD